MRNLILIVFVLVSMLAHSQKDKESILEELKSETISGSIRFPNKTGSTKIVYKICEEWSENIEFLKTHITDYEIEELEKNENATLNVIALVSKLERKNEKEYAIEILNTLIETEVKYISTGCYDAISTMSIAYYFLFLISDSYLIFKPKFELSKEEKQDFENRILIAEREYLRD
ncbi:hypothetical protein EVU94_13840 [Flavobacteriaceae bacterium 144Ye]|nr:hypothetical protein EVU94_13840 [Flavobacteriaceae bacterium 144Ye]